MKLDDLVPVNESPQFATIAQSPLATRARQTDARAVEKPGTAANRPATVVLVGVRDPEALAIRQVAGDLGQFVSIPQAALSASSLRATDAALVVLDMGGSGQTLRHGSVCRLLRRSLSAVQVLLLADREDDYGVCDALSDGACDVIARPLVPSVLRARLQTQLNLVELRRRTRAAHDVAQRRIESLLNDIDCVRSGFIHSIGLLAEVRDRDTGAHLQRTRAFMRQLVDGLRASRDGSRQLTPREGDLIVQAAPLHDIGKIAIPDSILLKPGKLTDDERAVVMTHAAIGGDAIDTALTRIVHDSRAAPAVGFTAASDLLQVAAKIARSHHERWDGTGYPDRLAGEQIPLAARLMSVADVYDALTSPRPYKRSWAKSDVVEYMRAGSGSQFDPVIVDAFLAERGNFDVITARYRAIS